MMYILNTFQYFLGFFEIYLGFKFLKKICNNTNLKLKQELYIVLATIILAFIENLNRGIRLYSIIILFFLIIAISLVYVILLKEKWRTVLLYTSLYCMSLELLDLFIIFSMGIVLQKGDLGIEIGRNIGVERIVALVLARLLMCLLYFFVTRVRHFALEKYKKGICLILFAEMVGVFYFQPVYAGYSIPDLAKDYFVYLIIILLAIMSFGIYSIYRNIVEENYVIKLRTDMIEKNYEDLKSYYNDSRVLFHNFEAHITLLQRYIKEGNIEKALAYINSISKPIDELEKQICTGNAAIDLVINYKLSEIKENGIVIEFDIPKIDFSNLNIEESDLFVVLFNLFENAIESCTKVIHGKKWIIFSLRSINDMYMFRIRNSINEKPRYENGIIVTGKKDKLYHGIGLESVKKLVEEYGGCFEYTYNDKAFEVIISFF